MKGYVDHGRRHLPGGTDPIPGVGFPDSAGTVVETLFLDSKVGNITTTTTLETGRAYLITVQGTYSVYNATLPVGTAEANAMFPGSMSGRSSSQVGVDSECCFATDTPLSSLTPGTHTDLFEIDLGSGSSHIEPEDGSHSTPTVGHFYKYPVTGEGSVVSFTINDTPLTDNYGKLKITIQSVGAGSVGGATGGQGSLLPDPTSEPDGDVLTTASGVAVWATPSGGSGSVATDAIFDAKGDLAVGTGANTAAKQTVGSNNTVLVADSSLTTGVKWVQVGEAMIALEDVTTANVSSSAHGFAPKSPADSTKFLDGSATPAWDTVKDSDLSTSDITTNDVSISKHGFAPKAPNDASKFLRGDGTWAVTGGGGGGSSSLASDVLWDAKGDLVGGTGADAASKLTVGSNGKLLVAASGETTGLKWDTGYLGGIELVYKYTVAGSDKASIDTGVDTAGAGTTDWTNGDVLEVWIVGRMDSAATADNFLITVNNDTGANYDRQTIVGQNTSAIAGANLLRNDWPLTMHGAGGTANYASSIRMSIPGYAGTTFYKIGEVFDAQPDGTASSGAIQGAYLGWRSTAAITRMKIAAPGSDKFKVGTIILIYKRRST